RRYERGARSGSGRVDGADAEEVVRAAREAGDWLTRHVDGQVLIAGDEAREGVDRRDIETVARRARRGRPARGESARRHAARGGSTRRRRHREDGDGARVRAIAGPIDGADAV